MHGSIEMDALAKVLEVGLKDILDDLGAGCDDLGPCKTFTHDVSSGGCYPEDVGDPFDMAFTVGDSREENTKYREGSREGGGGSWRWCSGC